MQPIVLPDETRYAEQMRSEVLPALAACSQRIPCTGEGGAALNVRLYAPAGAQRSIVLSHGFCESEEKLRERLERIEALEKEVKAREKALKKAETAKKQIIFCHACRTACASHRQTSITYRSRP